MTGSQRAVFQQAVQADNIWFVHDQDKCVRLLRCPALPARVWFLTGRNLALHSQFLPGGKRELTKVLYSLTEQSWEKNRFKVVNVRQHCASIPHLLAFLLSE